MKIAICYSGNIRTYETCVKNHSSLLESADIFISTWDDFGFRDTINDSWHILSERTNESLVTEEYIIKNTPNNFNIVEIKIEKYDSHLFYSADINISFGLQCQYYKIKDSYDLLLNSGKKYDYVIRLRPDITVNSFIFLKDLIVFNTHIWEDFPFNVNRTCINEMIWISNMDIMEKSVNIYNNLHKIDISLDTDTKYGESICLRNLEIEKINKKIKTHDFNYRVIR
jgi:hypothetical protein